MAISEEEIRIVLNTADSTSKAHALATEVVTLTGSMKSLAEQFNAGTVSEAAFRASSEQLQGSLRDRSALLEGVARNTGLLGKSHADLGQATLQASYAVQDFTSQLGTQGLAGAIASVQNNIPGILAGLGVGGGLAGVISVVSIAAAAALPKIMELFGAMDAEKIKEAADATKKLADETERFKALTTPDRKKQESEIEQFVAASGPDDVLKGIRAALYRRSARMGITPDEGEIEQQARELATGMAADPTRRNTVGILAAEHPDAFPRHFAEGLETLTPEAIRGQEQDDANLDADEEARKLRKQALLDRGREHNRKRKAVEANLDRATNRTILEENQAEAENTRDANAQMAANRAKDAAAAKAKRAMEQTPAILNAAQKAIQGSKDLMQRQAVEREINARSGGNAPYKDIQEAAKRTLDLTARGVNLNDAIIAAMREQGAKMDHLNARVGGQEQEIARFRQQQRQGRPGAARRVQ